jgi:site-specific DNA recombinase
VPYKLHSIRWGDPFGDHPFTTEQARLVQLLVERVDVHEDALEVRIRAAGLASLVAELRQPDERKAV